MDKKKFLTIAGDGVIRNNPTLKLVLGTCPTLALSTSAISAFGMGVSVMIIMTLSNAIVSLLRKIVPDEVRIPAYVMIFAALVTAIRMLMEKYIPDLFTAMGVYLPLIVVNCIIFARAEGFANKNPVFDSALDGLFNGMGFCLAIGTMGIVREILGAGAVFGIKIWELRIAFFTTPAGAFFVYGMFIALYNAALQALQNRKHKRSFLRTLQSMDAQVKTEV